MRAPSSTCASTSSPSCSSSSIWKWPSLFPWAVTLGDIGLFGFWSMVLFLGILTIGFIYEWKKGALEWE